MTACGLSVPKETVSVVIPFFNATDTLERALCSVEAQTHQVLEVIIVDDASEPGQRGAVDVLAERFPFVRFSRLEENSGPAAARNRGIELARGEFVALLDADDYWLPEKLSHALNVMRETGIDFVGHNNIVSGEQKFTVTDHLHPQRKLYRMNRLDLYIATSQFAPTTVVFRNGRVPVWFDESLRRSEDYRLWGDLVFRGYGLWKLKEFLSVREEPHIKGRGLSGNVEKLLSAHLKTVEYFRTAGYVSWPTALMMNLFLRIKYLRHR